MRLDVKMVKMNIAKSREGAKKLILSGSVSVNGKIVQKPDLQVENGVSVGIDDKQVNIRYASRGAYKIMWATREFNLDFYGKKVLDLGSSNGGFTDFVLQQGAGKIISVDVGYGLLDWRLRNDSRVIVLERTNARYLKPEDVPYLAEIVMGDLSFISLRLIIPSAAVCSTEDAEFIFLVKPQFEVGREKVQKGGIVKDETAIRESIMNIYQVMKGNYINFIDMAFSPIRNRHGNIEYFIYAGKVASSVATEEVEQKIKDIIEKAKIFFGEEERN